MHTSQFTDACRFDYAMERSGRFTGLQNQDGSSKTECGVNPRMPPPVSFPCRCVDRMSGGDDSCMYGSYLACNMCLVPSRTLTVCCHGMLMWRACRNSHCWRCACIINSRPCIVRLRRCISDRRSVMLVWLLEGPVLEYNTC